MDERKKEGNPEGEPVCLLKALPSAVSVGLNAAAAAALAAAPVPALMAVQDTVQKTPKDPAIGLSPVTSCDQEMPFPVSGVRLWYELVHAG
jgi:hypothetical protein